MKSTSLILLVLVAFATSAPRNTLKEGLFKLFTKWKNDDTSSLPFTLPSPRDISVPNQSRYYKGSHFYISDVVLKGLETLSVDRLSVTETDEGMTAYLEISVPRMKLTAGYYSITSDSFWKSFSDSSGSYYESVIYNFRVTATVSFRGDDSNTEMSITNMDYSYYDTKSYLRDCSIFVSNKFEDRLEEYLNRRKYSLIDEATTKITSKVNNVLRGYSPERLKNILREI